MDQTRRDLLKKASASIAPLASLSGCTTNGENYEEIEELYIDTDIDEAHNEIAGTKIHVNVRAYAEDDNLQGIEIQYTEPGEDDWQPLTEETTKTGEAEIVEPFNGETNGTYEFRTVAYLEGENPVTSNEEEIKFF